MPDPCAGRWSGEHDLTALAAAPGGFFAARCSPHSYAGGALLTSGDGGNSWQLGGAVPAGVDISLLAAASPTSLVVASGAISGGGSYTASLFFSPDAGRHWTEAATDSQQIVAQVPAWLGFETAEVGRWIGDPHGIWTTQDGGARWTKVQFP